MSGLEINFDGIVGPTHNYGGLSFGNVASMNHRADESRPREAALQGLRKMKLLHDLGVPQAVLPPHDRPAVAFLRTLGFSGSDARVIDRAYRQAPEIFFRACSASAMWTANAATVSPASDTVDGRTHFTPANLSNEVHRSLEAETTARFLRKIFSDKTKFCHHDPLPAAFGDEGAANHTRLCARYGDPGVEVFVYGGVLHGGNGPKKFPVRQLREASEAVIRLHGLETERALLVQQHPAAVDAGVFHNDVIAVGDRDLLLYHERAFAGGEWDADVIREGFAQTCGRELLTVCIEEQDLSLTEAVQTYLFNSQIVQGRSGERILIAPIECEEHESVRSLLAALEGTGTTIGEEQPFSKIEFVDLRQSMRNGGGPACLRLRVALSEEERAAVHPGVMFDEAMFTMLGEWINRNYREELNPADLRDPQLLEENRRALDELTGLLSLGTVYDFQR